MHDHDMEGHQLREHNIVGVVLGVVPERGVSGLPSRCLYIIITNSAHFAESIYIANFRGSNLLSKPVALYWAVGTLEQCHGEKRRLHGHTHSGPE